MKNTKRTITVFLVALIVVCTLCLTLTACHKNKPSNNPSNPTKIYDSETRPFSMSISTPDGVFNPFFSTSAYDSNIISMTQIAMLNTDKEGGIVYGENEPTVVKDMTEERNEKGNTVYQFLIKNGIKFSDGIHDLTIKDVLFNLYVYLDPAYTGSATIYSTDIVGLKNYRMQTLSEIGDTSDFESQFISAANMRLDNDIKFVQVHGRGVSDNNKPSLPSGLVRDDVLLDYAKFAKAFLEELNTDWNNINVGDYDWRNRDDFIYNADGTKGGNLDKDGHTYEYYEQFLLKEKWQIFLLNDAGYTHMLKHENDDAGSPFEKVNGNVLLNEQAAEDVFMTEIFDTLKYKGLVEEDGDSYKYTIDQNDEKEVANLDKAIKEICVNSVFKTYFSDSKDLMNIITREESKFEFKEGEADKVMASLEKTNAGRFESVARYWVSGSNMLEDFIADAKSDYFAKGDRVVKTIKGITTFKTQNFNGKSLGAEYDVLSIEINGVDPKAIYNFSFTVAPMYYYSTTSWNNGKGGGNKNYIEAFNADPEVGEFGLEFGNSKFMTEVVNDSTKIGLPMGAGAYMASGVNGGAGTAKSFFDNNMIYYERNPYFYTLGTGIENAKIKNVRYKVVETDQIINYLTTGNIDFGDPNATQTNIQILRNAGLNVKSVSTNGYGYVGINPRFVPTIEIRRAIMKAMEADLIHRNYYQGDLCTIINRPMSMNNWAYPKGVGVYESEDGTSYEFDSTGREIRALLQKAGYTPNGEGVYHKVISGFGDDVLDYKFTIAGGSTDHPAYAMFLQAARILNSCGFRVQVVTSQTALTDLSAGKLEVWAAAWSSTIDPDMFQVYHKDSQASSTKNWGYAQILGGTCPAAWGDELVIVNELSQLIDEGRSVTDKTSRMATYKRALDKVMELAVEFPTYQRSDLSAYKANLLDPSTLTPDKDVTPYNGLLARIWEVDYL